MIFVDELKRYRRQAYCHMVSDVSLDELHEFARSINVAKQWFHKDHYDLRSEERTRAVAAGAIESSTRELILCRRRMRS